MNNIAIVRGGTVLMIGLITACGALIEQLAEWDIGKAAKSR